MLERGEIFAERCLVSAKDQRRSIAVAGTIKIFRCLARRGFRLMGACSGVRGALCMSRHDFLENSQIQVQDSLPFCFLLPEKGRFSVGCGGCVQLKQEI